MGRNRVSADPSIHATSGARSSFRRARRSMSSADLFQTRDACSETRSLVARKIANKKGGRSRLSLPVRAPYWMTISTRRFCGSRTLSPVGTSSWVSPLPMTVIACAGTPSRTSASLTALARRSDSAML